MYKSIQALATRICESEPKIPAILVRDLLTAADIAAEIGVDAVTVRRRAEALGLGRRVGHAIVFDITDVVRLREPRTPGWPKGRRRTVEPG